MTRTEQAAAQEGKSCRARLAQPALELLTNPSQAGHAEQRRGQNTRLCLQLFREGRKVTREEERPLLLLKTISEPLSGQ